MINDSIFHRKQNLSPSGESTLLSVLARMGQPGDTHSPDRNLEAFHDKKYEVFKKMAEDQIAYRKIMND